MNSEIISFNSQFITTVICSLYKNQLSNSWTSIRYCNFLDFANIVITTTTYNRNYNIIYTLKIFERYIGQFQHYYQLQKSEKSIFLTAFRITQKYLDDFYYIPWEVDLSLLTELNSVELKQFEWQFLNKINYQVTMTPYEYSQWEADCQYVFVTFIPPPLSINKWTDDVGLPSPPSSVISNTYWTLSSDDDLFFNDEVFDYYLNY